MRNPIAVRGRVRLAAGALALAMAHGALAVDVPTAGTIRDPLRQGPAVPDAQAPAVSGTERPASGTVPAGGPRIPIRRFELTGNRSIPTDELMALLRPSEGQALTLLEIYDLADRLTALYRERGYALATVNVPAQKVSTGVVRLQVVEGLVGGLIFEGNQRYTSDFLGGYFSAIRPGDIVDQVTLEESLLHVNDLPGIDARAVIRPGAAFGTSDIVIRSEEDTVVGALRMDNHGRETIGEKRLTASVAVHNPLRLGDSLTFAYLHAERSLLRFGSVSYSLPVNRRGTRISASLARYVYDVDTSLIGFGGSSLSGSGNDFRLDMLHPVIRSRTENLYLGGGFSRTETEEKGTNLLALSTGRNFINLFNAQVIYSLQHARGASTSVAAVFSTNLEVNPRGTTNNAQPGRLEVDLNHLRPLPYFHDWTLSGRFNGVVTLDPLVDTERFRVGGPGSVRAFPSAEIAGDAGFQTTVEVRRPWRFADGVPGALKAFWDYGEVRSHRAGVLGEPPKQSLSGIGVGASAQFRGRYTVDFEWARPLNNRRVSDGEDSGRIWLGLSATF